MRAKSELQNKNSILDARPSFDQLTWAERRAVYRVTPIANMNHQSSRGKERGGDRKRQIMGWRSIRFKPAGRPNGAPLAQGAKANLAYAVDLLDVSVPGGRILVCMPLYSWLK